MYYCIVCKELHHPDEKHKEAAEEHVMFKTGFHYINSMLYQAGFCQTVDIPSSETKSATA